jgi:hypothetical protein
MDVKQIARVCHEANKGYCNSILDNTQPDWEDAPLWQRESAMKGVMFHWQTLTAGHEPSPEASHNSWLKEKEKDGWKYGTVKDPEKKEHPCFVSYVELPLEQRMKDYIFCGIVEAFFKASGGK